MSHTYFIVVSGGIEDLDLLVGKARESLFELCGQGDILDGHRMLIFEPCIADVPPADTQMIG